MIAFSRKILRALIGLSTPFPKPLLLVNLLVVKFVQLIRDTVVDHTQLQMDEYTQH
jgi:hypothetical protein